jgi:aconitate hydratase
MNEFNAVPTLVDFISINEDIKNKSTNILVKPEMMVDVVVDNIDINEQKNKERYTFLKYIDNTFKNISIIPPNTNTLNQVNLEYLSTMISMKQLDDKAILFPESILGTDLHSSMINSLGVLALNVGRIEIQSVMLDSSISLELPKTIGIELKGSLGQGTSFNDVLLTLKNILINNNINGKVVEFYGEGLKNISLEDRTILSNLVSQYKGICGYFPVDNNTIFFIEQTRGVNASLIKMYYEKQNLYLSNKIMEYEETFQLDLSLVKAIGIALKRVEEEFYVSELQNKLKTFKKGNFVQDNDIVLALIDICSNTTNPSLLIQASLVAKKACELGININRNISRYLTFDSLVQKQFLEKLDLLKYLEKLGFKIVKKEEISLIESISLDIEKFNLDVSFISFSDEISEIKNSKLPKSKWVFSPALLIAYCLKGNMNFDITKENINQDIYLSNIWPSMNEVNEYLEKLDYSIYKELYENIFVGNSYWQDLNYVNSDNYSWDENSTYVSKTNTFNPLNRNIIDIKNARILALLEDNINTEKISPLGKVAPYSPTALYLQSKGLRPDEFDSFENRYADSLVMIKSILSNINLQNKIVSPKEGGYTKDFQKGEIMSIYDFSLRMKGSNTPLVIFAGNSFGIGDINDWSVKGLKLLGVEAIVAKSFCKKYKNDLVRLGILPLEFVDDDIESLKLKGNEIINIQTNRLRVNDKIDIEICKGDEIKLITLQSKLDNDMEIEYYKNGGVLEYLLKDVLK